MKSEDFALVGTRSIGRERLAAALMLKDSLSQIRPFEVNQVSWSQSPFRLMSITNCFSNF
jgi:hypothetical protein